MTRVNSQTGLPASVSNDPEELRTAIEHSNELLRRWNGEGLDPGERVITLAELSGALEARGFTIGGDGSLIDGGETEGHTPVSRLAGLSGQGAFEKVILEWTGIDQTGYAFTEIWRAEEDTIAKATLRGRSVPGIFVDDARSGHTYYYWVRPVSVTGAEGPFTDSLQAETSRSPDAVREALTSTVWGPDTTYRQFEVVRPTSQMINVGGVRVSFQAVSGGTSGGSEPNWKARVNELGDEVTDNGVTWRAVDAGQAPLVLGEVDGDPVVFMQGATIENASIGAAQIGRAAIEQAHIADAAIGAAKIGDAEITSAKIGSVIQSDNYEPSRAGWRITKSGAAEFANAQVRGVIEGSTVRGSRIEGSVVVGSAFVAVTELDPGDNSLVGLTMTLSWSDTVSSHDGNASRRTEGCDIRSANHSDTDIYRRFRRHHIDGTFEVSFEKNDEGGYFRGLRIIVYEGDDVVIDTGSHHYDGGGAGGTYWSLNFDHGTEQSCSPHPKDPSHEVCDSWEVLNGATFTLENYPFNGDGLLSFWVEVDHAYFNAFPWNAVASTIAYNDY